MLIIILLFILLIVIAIYFIRPTKLIEKYNDEVGTYCYDCNLKNTLNKCVTCYNCVWLYGKHKCVPGSSDGPYDTRNKWKWVSGTDKEKPTTEQC